MFTPSLEQVLRDSILLLVIAYLTVTYVLHSIRKGLKFIGFMKRDLREEIGGISSAWQDLHAKRPTRKRRRKRRRRRSRQRVR